MAINHDTQLAKFIEAIKERSIKYIEAIKERSIYYLQADCGTYQQRKKDIVKDCICEKLDEIPTEIQEEEIKKMIKEYGGKKKAIQLYYLTNGEYTDAVNNSTLLYTIIYENIDISKLVKKVLID